LVMLGWGCRWRGGGGGGGERAYRIVMSANGRV